MHGEGTVTGLCVAIPAHRWLVATQWKTGEHGAIGWYEDVVGVKYPVKRRYGNIEDLVSTVES